MYNIGMSTNDLDASKRQADVDNGNSNSSASTSSEENISYHSSDIKELNYENLFLRVKGAKEREKAELRKQKLWNKEMTKQKNVLRKNLDKLEKDAIKKQKQSERIEKRNARKEKFRASFLYRHFIKGWHILIPITILVTLSVVVFIQIRPMLWKTEEEIAHEELVKYASITYDRDDVYRKAVEIYNSEDGGYEKAITFFDETINESEGESKELIKIAKATFMYEFSLNSLDSIVEALDEVDINALTTDDVIGYYYLYVYSYERVGNLEKATEYREKADKLATENDAGPPEDCDLEKLANEGNC